LVQSAPAERYRDDLVAFIDPPVVRISLKDVCFSFARLEICTGLASGAARRDAETALIQSQSDVATAALIEAGLIQEREMNRDGAISVILGPQAAANASANLVITPRLGVPESSETNLAPGRLSAGLAAPARSSHDTNWAAVSAPNDVDFTNDNTIDLESGSYVLEFEETSSGVYEAVFTSSDSADETRLAASYKPNDPEVTPTSPDVEIGSFCIWRFCIP
jgi:hypothetical protein